MTIIKILGTGCKKCQTLEAKVRDLIASNGIDAEVEKVTDINKMIDRIKKYMDMYIIYETYSKKEDVELKAIRHSFSHSRDRLTHKQTIIILKTSILND